jgi:cob(I)alamin adenosyltransferase
MARGLGLVQVYTGDGKGKTTAALGLALRASGQGLRVQFLQFLKGYPRCGEHRALEQHALFSIVQPASSSAFRVSPEEARRQAVATLELARTALGGDYDLVVLDEILTAVKIGSLATDEVLALVRGRAAGVELVLTGRGAGPEVLAEADLVTEMLLVKHPFQRGVKARKGIEY